MSTWYMGVKQRPRNFGVRLRDPLGVIETRSERERDRQSIDLALNCFSRPRW